MSYAKAMKHTRNVRKCRKQSKMYMGFNTGLIGNFPSFRSTAYGAALCEVRDWFRQRNDDGMEKRQYNRECVREALARLLTAKSNMEISS